MSWWSDQANALGAVVSLSSTKSGSQWTDDSGNGHHADVIGSPDLDTNDAGNPSSPGSVGRYRLRDPGERLEIPHHADLNFSNGQFTIIIVWTHWNGEKDDTEVPACYAAKGSAYQAALDNSAHRSLAARIDDGGDPLTAGSALGDWNERYFIGLRSNGTTFQRFFAGDITMNDEITYGTSRTFPGSMPTNTEPLVIGARLDNGDGYANGDYAAFAAFPSYLSGAELESMYDSLTVEPTTPDPANLQFSLQGEDVELTWNASPTSGVTEYAVFRRTPQTGSPFDPESDTPIATTGSTTYTDEDVPEGEYDYQVFGVIPGSP